MAKIVLIGAGSAMFGLGALGDIFKSKTLIGSEIALVDINKEALENVETVTRKYIKDNGLDYRITATTDRTKALPGADFVLISIEIGNRYELWEMDWNFPLHFGIKQTYGENGGPGGIFHSLRIIPPILAICGDIEALCPDCLVMNLSNPMTNIMTAISKKYPKLHVIGLCHEVSSMLTHLPKILQVPFEDLDIRCGGFNHFSVLLSAKNNKTGEDVFNEIMHKAPAYFAGTEERGLFLEIMKYFKRIPITTDSHFSEYIHWSQEVADHAGIMNFYTNYKKECLGHQVDMYDRLQSGTMPEEYWRVVPIIEGILNNTGHEELAVNIINNGYISSLPEDMIVEVPGFVDKEGVRGINIDQIMPLGFSNLLMNRVGVLRTCAEAAIQGSRELALQALLIDPTNNSILQTEKLLDTIILHQKKYLGYLK
ncbi:alpha-glucosidase [uncultured Sphaerochaeta sp.]|uniref:family 4 glycosyl hydrolase n=1 Tax=uncultured Sphaerochaeta sp. TaxID=886478 RepID=UPI002A0A7C2B|nr:alpha-glucosidase [uncultured Sphaerochaeta sp.]